MKMIPIYCLFLLYFSIPSDGVAPSFLLGDFTDDYGIKYSITDTSWIQYPDFEISIVTIDTAEMYVLGYNVMDSSYTKIDYMPFQNQGEYTWGYCYTTYEQKDQSDALSAANANRATPKTGCNGFPFSRMKPVNGF